MLFTSRGRWRECPPAEAPSPGCCGTPERVRASAAVLGGHAVRRRRRRERRVRELRAAQQARAATARRAPPEPRACAVGDRVVAASHLACAPRIASPRARTQGAPPVRACGPPAPPPAAQLAARRVPHRPHLPAPFRPPAGAPRPRPRPQAPAAHLPAPAASCSLDRRAAARRTTSASPRTSSPASPPSSATSPSTPISRTGRAAPAAAASPRGHAHRAA